MAVYTTLTLNRPICVTRLAAREGFRESAVLSQDLADQ